jgi:membrane protease YdiL (CAAX protease family)
MRSQILDSKMDTEQHPLVKSAMLHLLPGVLILLFFIVVAPILRARGLPSLFTQFLAVLVVLIPFELGYILYQAKRKNRKFSLKRIVLYREKIPKRHYLLIVPPLLSWGLIVFLVIARPVDRYLIENCFSWLPEWFFLHIDPAEYSRSAILATWVLGVLFNAVAGPVVEELYFRGYLLPRISRLKGWAPLFNVLLFSLYHFFTPWQNPARILAMLPGIYVVQRKKNIYLGMIPHCLLNTTGMILMTPLLFA